MQHFTALQRDAPAYRGAPLLLSDAIGRILPPLHASTTGKYGPADAGGGVPSGSDGVHRGLLTLVCVWWFLGVEGSVMGQFWTSTARGGMPLLCMLWGWHCVRPAHPVMQYITVPTAVVSVLLCWWLALGATTGNHHDVSLVVVSIYVAAHTIRRLDAHDIASPVAVVCTLCLQLVLCLMAGMMRDRRAVVAAWGLVTLASVCWVETGIGGVAGLAVARQRLASVFGGTATCSPG